MDIQRTITILIEADTDLERTLEAFREVQQTLSAPCFNEGKPLGALALQRLMYHEVKGSLSAQMTISAIRTVCAAYLSARSIPEDFKMVLTKAKEIDCLSVIIRDGKLLGRVALTLAVPSPQGILPVGIDLNETNALVAVDPDGRELFISGKLTKRGKSGGRALRRRLSLWQRGAIRHATSNKAQEYGLLVTSVDPRYTSRNCSHCGLRGIRRRHSFRCPHCGYTQHADINAALNLRNRYTVFRDGGESSISPEALSLTRDEGKPPPQRHGVID